MSEERSQGSDKDQQRFEVFTAVLLGLAAVGAAVAALQAGQWGGKQLDAFAEANTLTTKASTQYNEDTVLMNADYAAVAVAKQHILEARDARDEQTRERHFDLASYFYMSQLSEQAYEAMELPAGYWEEDEEEEAAAGEGEEAAAAADETAAAEAGTDEEEGEDAPEAALEREIPDEDLIASLPTELDDDYADKMLAAGNEMFAEADKRFIDGRKANENGDGFDLVGVFFTVALFFAGLGLVFKSKVRWVLFALGLTVFVLSAIAMLRLPWAS